MSRKLQNSDVARGREIYEDELSGVKDIAVFLSVPVSWVYERTRRRGNERIPHFKLGKYLRFSRTEIIDWVHQQRGNSLAPR